MTDNKGATTAIGGGKIRSSNLELYRIVCMLLILTHHYACQYFVPDGPVAANPRSANSLFLMWIGMWGKTGINCFLMITGYYMCKSQITLRKFLKLILEVYFYSVLIYLIFVLCGREPFTPMRLFRLAMPVWGFETNFVSCFIGFWLTIPFLNILVQNMTQKQHQLLLALLLTMYTLLGTIPGFKIGMNYITWFGVIYFIASYIRLYPNSVFENKKLWRHITFCLFLLASVSIVMMQYLFQAGAYFVSDSNKIFAVAVAVSSFLWFKNMQIPNSKIINWIGGSTFGVLLIHTSSDAMRQFLWRDTFNCVSHYDWSLLSLAGYSIFVVATIFSACIIIDRLRIRLIEEPFFKWYDRILSIKISNNKIFKNIKQWTTS